MKRVDVEGIRPRKVQVYLLGSEMGGNANLHGLGYPNREVVALLRPLNC